MAFKIVSIIVGSVLLLQAASACGGNCGCSGNSGNIGLSNIGLSNIGSGCGCSSNLGLSSNIGLSNIGLSNIGSGCGYGGNLGLSSNIGTNLGGYSSGYGLGGNLGGLNSGVAVASGGGLEVSIYSPIAPSGISILSENAIEGPLNVCGALPVLSAVGINAQLPTSGSAGVEYSCGNGNIGVSSDCGGYGFGSGSGYSGSSGLSGARIRGAGLGGRIGGCGCGCGCGCGY